MENSKSTKSVFNFFASIKSDAMKLSADGYYRKKIKFSLSEWKGTVSLDRLESLDKSKGYGTEFILWLTDLADAHGVTLDLIPCADYPYTDKELVAWYREAGFKPDLPETMMDCFAFKMIREPRPKPFTLPAVGPNHFGALYEHS